MWEADGTSAMVAKRRIAVIRGKVAIIGTIFFIAIIDNFFKIIAIISVIGDKFGKIIQVIFVCNLHT